MCVQIWHVSLLLDEVCGNIAQITQQQPGGAEVNAAIAWSLSGTSTQTFSILSRTNGSSHN